ncbi:substrate-binding periplasmic protein [Marinobacter mobilis]|uniref:substrate-binding periplasmic protein n=1 Tax=Marinobacter mobilis TaxID=488533 RepID=UPI0035C6FABC
MIRLFRVLGLAAMVGWGVLPAALAAQELQVNYLVVDSKVGPFQIIQDDRSSGGIISDIVDEIFRGTGYTVEHLVRPVNRLTRDVADQTYPNWVAFDAPVWHSFGDEGEYASVPLFETRHVMLTCRTDIPNPVDSVRDLESLSIATLRGFKYLQLDEAAANDIIRPVPVDNFNAGLTLVSLGRVDGFVEMQSRLRFHLGGFAGDTRCMREVDVSAVIPNYSLYLAMDRRMPEPVKQLINDRLRAMRSSGDIDRIWRIYIPDQIPSEIQVKTGH